MRVDWRGDHEVALCAPTGSASTAVDRELSERIRASFLLAGPLLARFGRADMPPPGGDVIGRRRLDPHLDAFRAMGATVDSDRDIVLERAAAACAPCEVFMDEPSVMATENALMAAALTPGDDGDRQRRLRAARAGPRAHARARWAPRSSGIGSNVLTVTGADRLGGCRARRSRPTTSRSARSWRSPA